MSKLSRSELVEYIVENIDSENIADVVAGYLIDAGKTNELESILRDVSEYRAKKGGVIEMTAVVARPLDSSSSSELEEYVKKLYPSAKNVVVNQVVDKTVIGGINLKFANANLDMTVRAKLNKLKEAVS